MESAHKIKTNHGHGKLLKLSEQEIVDCTSQHCGGGYPDDAFSWVKRNGIATESEYGGYEATVDSCRADMVRPPAVRVKDYSFVPKNSEKTSHEGCPAARRRPVRRHQSLLPMLHKWHLLGAASSSRRPL